MVGGQGSGSRGAERAPAPAPPPSLQASPRSWASAPQPGVDLPAPCRLPPLPHADACPAGFAPVPAPADPEANFTPRWEFTHLAENAFKYRLTPGEGGVPEGAPACNAFVSTTAKVACYNVRRRRGHSAAAGVTLPGCRAGRVGAAATAPPLFECLSGGYNCC